jgi:heme A synthase
MNVEDFKSIFNIEYYHRFLGNCIAYSLAVPMTYFWYNGYFTTWMKYSLVGLVGFGGL